MARELIELARNKTRERVILCGLQLAGSDPRLFEEDMQEMALLCDTAGATVIDTVIQKRDRPEAATYLGSGKLQALHGMLTACGADTLVIDAELSPAQIREIEAVVQVKVVDRSQLILDIFARHARTNEARIQVELAQLRTLYPRLTHAWTHFSQQVGGIGTRGPGEKQLEVDRRLVQRKIADLRARLKKIEKVRHTQRSARRDVFSAAIVGYTNVGKSSILNALCNAQVQVADKLFATLDTASRRLYLPEAGTVIVSDTVGFIRKLPHHLVASFRSTLEVVCEADLLMLVVDASRHWCEQEVATVNQVLEELGAAAVPRLVVFNKCDLLDDPFESKRLALAFGDALFMSALRRDDITLLKERFATLVLAQRRRNEIAALIEAQSRAVRQAWQP